MNTIDDITIEQVKENINKLKMVDYIRGNEDFPLFNSARITTWEEVCDAAQYMGDSDILDDIPNDEKRFHSRISISNEQIEYGRFNIFPMIESLMAGLGQGCEEYILSKLYAIKISPEAVKSIKTNNSTIKSPNLIKADYKNSRTMHHPQVSYLLKDNQFITIDEGFPQIVIMEDELKYHEYSDRFDIWGDIAVRFDMNGFALWEIE